MSDELIREVDEAMASDKAAAGWRRAAPFVYGAIAFAIGGVAIQQYLSWSKSSKIEASALEYAAAIESLEADEIDTARTQLAGVSERGGGFAVLAEHVLAQLERDSEDKTVALQHYSKAAAASDDVLGDLALLKAGYVEADTLNYDQLKTKLEPLLSRGGAASSLAAELLAARALADGDIARARREYQTLSLDLNAPTQLRTRVQQALSVLPASTPTNSTEPASAVEGEEGEATSPAQQDAAEQ